MWAYREVDRLYNDYLVESAVALLHCAQWFKREVEARPGGGSAAHAQPGDADDADEYHEMLQYRFGGSAEAEYDEDYYYGLQDRLQGSGRAVGNRRWGEGGFVQGGGGRPRRARWRRRAQARPAAGKGRVAARRAAVQQLRRACGSGRRTQAVAREPSESAAAARAAARELGRRPTQAEKAALSDPHPHPHPHPHPSPSPSPSPHPKPKPKPKPNPNP